MEKSSFLESKNALTMRLEGNKKKPSSKADKAMLNN